MATLTARYVRAVEGTGARILDTRKTTPGMRALEKQAVLAGGGASHRAGLYDAILVKENHAALAGGVGEATRRALEVAPAGVDVVVECASAAEVEEALVAGAPRVLLDNMAPSAVREAAALVAGRAVIEVSGGVTLDGVRELAEAGAELISVGRAHPLGARARPEPVARAALAPVWRDRLSRLLIQLAAQAELHFGVDRTRPKAPKHRHRRPTCPRP